MQESEKLLNQCVNYFKNTQGFKKVFQKIKEKYQSLGTLGGTIVITNLKKEEKEALTGLLRKNYNEKSATIKVEAFVKALETTKFSEVNFEEVLMMYFGEKLISKKDEKNIYQEEKSKFLNKILEEFKGSKAEEWLRWIFSSKENAYRIISQKYDENRESLKELLSFVCNGYNSLSFDTTSTVRLALFASIITKNPHSFDDNTDGGKLLAYSICFKLSINYPVNAEELSGVLYQAGIIKDEVSNFTLCSGVLGYKNGILHEGWTGFYDNYEPLQLSLWNISSIDKIESPSGKVYVFENPTVFSEVLYKTKEKKPSLLCTFGHFRLASLIVLDKLVESGAMIYYSGDFDPEGINIADKLKQRYGDRAVLWRYNLEEYNSIKSEVTLSEARIKKLDNVKSEELCEVVNAVKNHRCAGYQELLIDKYVDDITVFTMASGVDTFCGKY